MAESKGNEAIVVLADTPYYESLESAMKIRKYVKQRNVSQLPKSVQKIISDQQDGDITPRKRKTKISFLAILPTF